MTTNDLIDYFGSGAAAIRSLNQKITRPAFQHWKKNGIPELRQRQFEEITGGALKTDPRFKVKQIEEVCNAQQN